MNYKQDPSLTWKAKGALAALIDVEEEDREMTTQTIAAFTKSGRQTTYTAIRELRKAGYINLITMRSQNGKLSGARLEIVKR